MMNKIFFSIILSTAIIACTVQETEETDMTETPMEMSTENSVVHTVYFWFTEDVSDTDHENFYGELQKIGDIPLIQNKWIGVPASTEDRDVVDSSYDYSITFVFANEEDEAAYQIHPIHLEFVENNSHLWERVAVYDATAPDQAD